MTWSLKIGQIAGTAVRIHITFLLFVAWIWAASYFADGAPAAWSGLAYILALFLCVLVHEFGHILTARAFGIATPDVTLLPIGGVARLERIPENPVQEFLIAIAGPLVNVAIAIVLIALFDARLDTAHLAAMENSKVSLIDRLAIANLFLAVFNMIPAFPMDGGRVLRALLAIRMEYLKATQIAAGLGQGLAFVFGFIGLFTNPFLLFIALFVWIGAAQEASAVQMKSAFAGTPIRAAMLIDFQVLGPSDTLADAVNLVLQGSQIIISGPGRAVPRPCACRCRSCG